MRGDRYELKAAHDTRIMWLLGYLQVSTVRESRGAFLPPPGGVTDLRSVTLNFSLFLLYSPSGGGGDLALFKSFRSSCLHTPA